jgi:LuxR family maltose regulon positive regulatory protein
VIETGLLDPTDALLLRRLHGGFPLTEAPYADVARELGLTEAEVIERLRRRCASRAAADLIGSELEPVRLYLDRLAYAFGSQRLGPARARPDHPALHLSQRELEVVKLLCNGFSNHQLSRHLAISPDTVKWHLKNIFGKLGVDNRSQAIVAAERLGLISIREQ